MCTPSLLPNTAGLPRFSGRSSNGDPVSGVTTMQMAWVWTTVICFLKEEVPLAADETGGSLFDKLAKAGGKLCVRTLEGLERGEITPIPQNEAEATHVGMIKKSMGEMDFSRSAIELERLVRGLNPWPQRLYPHRHKNPQNLAVRGRTETAGGSRGRGGLHEGAPGTGNDLPH